MARKITAGPTTADNSYTFSEGAGFATTLNVRANDGKSSSRPLYSLDNNQLADLDAADPISTAATTSDRSALGAAIWINADGTVGYSTAPIAAQVNALAPGQTLQDSFLYATLQANGSLLWSTVRITITGTNDIPVARVDTAAAGEDAVATGSVATNDSDVDNGAVLKFAAASSPVGFNMSADGSWTFDASHTAYQDLAAGEVRQVVINYTATDQYNASSSSSLTIVVTGTNDAPVATAAGATVAEGGSVSGRVLATDADRGDSVRYALVNDAPAGLRFASDGTWSFDGRTAGLEALAAGETQTLLVDYTATDQVGSRGTSTLTITVVGANDEPVAVAATATAVEDGYVLGQLSATDADNGATLTYSAGRAVPPGFTLNADGSWAFDTNFYEYQSLAEGETQEFTIGYSVSDEHGASSASTLTITLTGANDAPGTTSHWAEAIEGETAWGQLMAVDQDHGAELSFTVDGEAPAGFALAADGSWTFDTSVSAYDGLLPGEWQVLQIPFSVADEHGASVSSFLLVVVHGTNDAPSLTGAPPQLGEGQEDSSFVLTQADLIAGWSDPETGVWAEGLTADGVSVTGNEDGSFTVTPAANFNGVLQLQYRVTDGLLSTAATAQVAIAAVNDAAVLSGTLAGSVTEATPFSAGVHTAIGRLIIEDPDNAPVFVVIDGVASTSGYGIVSLSEGGEWKYTLNNDAAAVNALNTGQSLSDSFTVTTLDGTTRTVTITINGGTDVVRQPGLFWGTGDSNDFNAPMAGGNPSTTIYDTSANDMIVGTGAAQTIYSLYGGNDTIYGEGGDDRIHGLSGSGTFYGQAGDDYLSISAASFVYGGTDDDEVSGSGSGDTMFGGSGIDTLRGNGGNDLIVGGYHIDNLYGGAGQDTFRFLELRDTGDHLLDFQYGIDLLDFAALDANQQQNGDQSFGWGGTTPTAFALWSETVNNTIVLYADTDGHAQTAEFMITFYNSNFAAAAAGLQVPDGLIL